MTVVKLLFAGRASKSAAVVYSPTFLLFINFEVLQKKDKPSVDS